MLAGVVSPEASLPGWQTVTFLPCPEKDLWCSFHLEEHGFYRIRAPSVLTSFNTNEFSKGPISSTVALEVRVSACIPEPVTGVTTVHSQMEVKTPAARAIPEAQPRRVFLKQKH